MATYRELQEQAQKLLEQAEQQRQKEVKESLDLIAKTMTDFDIGLEELFDHLKSAGFKAESPRRTAKNKVKAKGGVPKFRNPSTDETWSGRGRAPAWLREAEEKGKSRDKFLIKS
ncbi:H-NS histone family protein [Ramlibacter sp.]|uniref:H-NS histone family protein n=1 Tax=Ramlibacter sp. TaxID=1917967 RepID=UPI001822035D|nr:H-NS histone family protein [Ramlibacter sp.]MBA2674322.1 H-NS histone family protein [Ramlibacter sp.]